MVPYSVRPPIFSAPCTALPSLVPRPCYSLVPMAAPVGSPSSSARVAPAPRLIHGRAPSVQLVEAPLPAASSCSSSPSALAPDFCAQLLSHGRVARSGVHRVQPACAPLAGQPQLSIAAHSFFPNCALPSVLLCSAALSARRAPWRLPWPSHRALRYCPCASSSRAESSPMLTRPCFSLPCGVVIISYRELDPRCRRASRVLVFVVELRLVRCRSSPRRVCSSSPKFGPMSSTRFGGARRVLHKYFRLAARTSPMSWSSMPRNHPRVVVFTNTVSHYHPIFTVRSVIVVMS
jgi:hypothetical protein